MQMGIAPPNVWRRVSRIAMTVCMDWQIGGEDPHCTALTFNYDSLEDAITH